MSRVFQDPNLLEWEAYASSGDFGFSEGAHIVFDCLTDRTIRPRFVERDGDKADAERAVATLPDEELVELLGRSKAVK